jgi:hypothetical protein
VQRRLVEPGELAGAALLRVVVALVADVQFHAPRWPAASKRATGGTVTGEDTELIITDDE